VMITGSKANRTLGVALIMIAVSEFGWANSRSNSLPNMPHHPGQGLYLQTATPLNRIRQPLLP
jgi:hypothetical protein